MIVTLPLLVGLLVFAFLKARDARLAALPDVGVGAPSTWAPTRVVVIPDRARAIGVLALAEARRVLTHPVLLAGVGIAFLAGGSAGFGNDPFNRYVEITGGGVSALYMGPIVFVASALCASRPRRARARELFDATAASPFDRTLAQCLAALGPFLVSFAYVLGLLAVYTVVGADLPAVPSIWELLTLPIGVLGAALLGVQTSRWLPFRGAPLLVLVAVVAAAVGVSVDAPYLTPFVEWPDYLPDGTYAMAAPGQPMVAHTLFILGLDVAAAIGALLTHREKRRLMLVLGFFTVVGTTFAGLAAT